VAVQRRELRERGREPVVVDLFGVDFEVLEEGLVEEPAFGVVGPFTRLTFRLENAGSPLASTAAAQATAVGVEISCRG
jgi:hypothetical protein